MRVKTLKQLFSGSYQATSGGDAALVPWIKDPDKPVALAILDALDASSDIGSIGTVKCAVDRSTRNAAFIASPGHKNDMPMRALVKARKVLPPDFIVFQQESSDYPLGRFDCAVSGRHRLIPEHRSSLSQSNRFSVSATGNATGTCRIRHR